MRSWNTYGPCAKPCQQKQYFCTHRFDNSRSNSPTRTRPLVADDEKRLRREIANSNERRRMQSINAGFTSLKMQIPHQDNEKLSKVVYYVNFIRGYSSSYLALVLFYIKSCWMRIKVNNVGWLQFDCDVLRFNHPFILGCYTTPSQWLHHDIRVWKEPAFDTELIFAETTKRNRSPRVLDYLTATQAKEAWHRLIRWRHQYELWRRFRGVWNAQAAASWKATAAVFRGKSETARGTAQSRSTGASAFGTSLQGRFWWYGENWRCFSCEPFWSCIIFQAYHVHVQYRFWLFLAGHINVAKHAPIITIEI